MLLIIENVLELSKLQAVQQTLSDSNLFEDGKVTAGRAAINVKSNLQASPRHLEVKGALSLIETALREHTVFRAAAHPLEFAKIMFNRYEGGMEYGSHVDNAFINDTRTDLSFTLFLSDPDTYDGGELVLQSHSGDEPIKLPAGSLVVYPSTSLHYVAKVQSGIRLAAVGWVKSRVRLAEHREILFDLQHSLANLARTEENQVARLSLLKAQNNLLRLWSD
ncbi:PKHD-type hydroxylase [Thalassocella blandensis]|nr:PKHD-type hydroxylase [Thalassocella blandensis]